MQDYPFVKCLHPRRVFNKYTGEWVLADCGKCEHCRLKSSLGRRVRCELENLTHRYCYFITLTYANKFLPMMQLLPRPAPETQTYDLLNLQTGEIVGEYTSPDSLYIFNLIKKIGVSSDDGIKIPILNTYDVQLFLKRLRKRFNHENLRLFYCGEYGPRHFRPHYHINLWCDTEQTASFIQQAVRSLWPYGRVDVSLARGQSLSYVASYVNSHQYVPPIYSLAKSSPFTHHSKHLGQFVVKNPPQTISELEPIRFSNQRICLDGFNREVFLWRSCKDKYFPRCKSYASKSYEQRVFTYKLNATISSWSQEISPTYNARLITDYIKYHDFYHPIPVLNQVLQYFRESTKIYKLVPKDKVKRPDFDNDLKPEDFYIIENYPAITDWQKFERQVYMELRLSNHFLRDLCNYDLNLIPSQVKKIEYFYDTLELHYINEEQKLLNRFFQRYKKQWDAPFEKLFFKNTLSIKALQNNTFFRRHKSEKISLAEDFVKHKKLNDINKIFCYG